MRRLGVYVGADADVQTEAGPPASVPPASIRVPRWAERGAPFWRSYYRFLATTAALHLVSAIASASFISAKSLDFPTKLCTSYTVWKPSNASYHCFDDIPQPGGGFVKNVCVRTLAYKPFGTLSPGALCVAFAFLSAFFQSLPLVYYDWYQSMLLQGRGPLRFVEYSLSATCLVLVVALLDGNTDGWLLLNVAAANWAIMIFGLVQEHMSWLLVSSPTYQPLSLHRPIAALSYLTPHLAGWVPFATIWAMLTTQFRQTLADAKGVPQAVKAIPYLELILFVLFGVNQTAGVVSSMLPGEAKAEKGVGWSPIHSEVTYTILSFVAKTMLVWLLFAGSTMQDPKYLVPYSNC